MKKYLIKGTYTYKVQKIILADSEEDAMATWEAGNVEPLCEWDSQEQDTYHEIINSIEEQRGGDDESI